MNIETYLGFRIEVTTELDPFKLTVLRERLWQLAELAAFDPDNFFVYFHNIAFIDVSKGHFLSGMSLSERIDRMEISYDVNPKQVKSGLIKFMNNYVDLSIELGIIDYWSSEYKLVRVYPGAFFERHGKNHQIEIVTFVHKDLRRAHHKKIKLTCQAFPSQLAFQKISNKKEYHVTGLDLRLDKDVNLIFESMTPEVQDSIKREIELMRSKRNSKKSGQASGAHDSRAHVQPASPSQQLNVFVNPVDIRVKVQGNLPELERRLDDLEIDRALIQELIKLVREEKAGQDPVKKLDTVKQTLTKGLGDITVNTIGGMAVELIKNYLGLGFGSSGAPMEL